MAELRIYGGDPLVIATLDEISRVANLLETTADLLDSATWQIGLNPIPNLQLAFLSPAISSRLRKLANACRLAALEYFSTESQLAAWFGREVEAWQSLGRQIGGSPGLGALHGGLTATTVAALAIAGLTGPPSQKSANQLRDAVSLAPTLVGAASAPSALKKLMPVLGKPEPAGAKLVGYQGTAPASSLYEHAKKLRSLYQQQGQIQIERFPQGDKNQYVVYIPGTQSVGKANPLNAKSNLYAMAGPNRAPSELAILSAMQQAGIGPKDRVLLVGHSQGALVASNIAASKEFSVSGLISFGGPIANSNLEHVPVIAMENSLDPVPGLGGRTNPLTESLVTVISDSPAESVVAAHSMDAYVRTAIEADLSTNSGLEQITRELEMPQLPGTSSRYQLFDLEDPQQGSSQEGRN